MKQKTTGFTPFELVHGRQAGNPIDLVMNFQGWTEIETPTDYAIMIKSWLEDAKEVALEKISRSYNDQAPRFNAKRRGVTFTPEAANT